jgi:hypothetical protein
MYIDSHLDLVGRRCGFVLHDPVHQRGVISCAASCAKGFDQSSYVGPSPLSLGALCHGTGPMIVFLWAVLVRESEQLAEAQSLWLRNLLRHFQVRHIQIVKSATSSVCMLIDRPSFVTFTAPSTTGIASAIVVARTVV